MRPVVADAGPLHYLLAPLFGRLLIPDAVSKELHHAATPKKVRAWLDAAPSWFECAATEAPDPPLPRGAGERAAIDLARRVDASLLLIDDRLGRASAEALGLATTGTLGVLVRAGQLGLLDLATSLAHLRTTNFRCRPELLDSLLTAYGR